MEVPSKGFPTYDPLIFVRRNELAMEEIADRFDEVTLGMELVLCPALVQKSALRGNLK
jgi:hypothetical protein